MTPLSPVRLSPAFKDYLWGGERLRTDYRKSTDLTPLAESWELSAHKDGESRIVGGKYDGYTLSAYVEAIGRKALGTRAERFDYFPILIKFIDARGDLSVQVHPSDAYALEHEGEYGKTEMWYILDCDEGASLYYGFSRDVTKDELTEAIGRGTLTELLRKVPVKKGDVFFIPAGTVHAIGAGIVICEIQQNSNTTYRVYDYNRRDKDGNLRPLHVEKALAVASLTKAPAHKDTPKGADVLLASCEYFSVRLLTVTDSVSLEATAESFHALTVTEGEGTLRHASGELPLRKGDTLFLPACCGHYTLEGALQAILSTL